MTYRRHPSNHVNGDPARQTYEEWIHAVRDFKWLVEWQRRNNFSDEQAADVLEVSVSQYRKMRSGKSPVTRQTAKLAITSVLDPLRMIKAAQFFMAAAEMAAGADFEK